MPEPLLGWSEVSPGALPAPLTLIPTLGGDRSEVRNPGLAACVFSLPVGVDSRVTESSESSLGTLGLGDPGCEAGKFSSVFHPLQVSFS